MSEAARPSLRGYLAALVAVGVATLVRVPVHEYTGGRFPYLTYVFAIGIVGLFFGVRPAIACMIASLPAGAYFFITPDVSEWISQPVILVRMATMLTFSIAITYIAARAQRTRQRLQETAAAEAQHALEVRAERKRLHDIITSIPGVVWEAWGEPDSNKQRIDYVSDYVATMVGYSPEEWTRSPNFWLQLVHPDDREQAAKVAAEKFASGETGENEFRWITKDGRTIWVLARSSTIKAESGRSMGMRGVTFDITQRKEVEQRLALLAEISTTGLTSVSFDELADRIARGTAEVVGDYCMIRMLRDGRLAGTAYAHAVPEAEPMLRAMAQHGDISSLNLVYADLVRNPRTVVENTIPDDSFVHVERTGIEDLFERFRARRGIFTPLLSQGSLVGTLAIGRASGQPFTAADAQFAEAIAARAALAFENSRLVEAAQRDAEEARQARAEAEEAGRIKDEFLATLSHELRTPLNAILGWAHLLRDAQLTPDRRIAAIDTILRNAQSQEQLIADILDVQRVMAGKIRLNLRSVDLGNVVRSAAETVQPSADAKQVRLQLVLDLDTPPVTGDSDRLQQIVWNLLSNAIKFAPQGGHVQVRLLKIGDECELVVEDDGPGIKPDFIPHMFERFRQADSSTTRTHKGLGLGLAIVRSLVEMHGGKISAANSRVPGATGAVFTIRLPRETAATPTVSPAAPAIDREQIWSEKSPTLDGVHVLVVEDEGDARDLIGVILQRCGADVTLTSSVPDAMTAFADRRPDVLVSDIEMPGEDGYSLIRRIRALTPADGSDVPAAALTAYASPADRMKVLGAGFNIHVAKPVQPAELAIVVASLAARRG
jgi:PAS domain S-box-containing protein